MKTSITPGKLYARLAALLRARRGDACRACAPGVPVLADGDHGNWELAPPARECAGCARVIAELVRGLQGQYELFDPTSPMHYMRHPAQGATRPH